MTREEAIQWLTNEKWKNANNKYKKEWNEAFDLAIEALQTDAVQGEWIKHKGEWIGCDFYPTKYECSQCRYYVDEGYDSIFCPNCGARMKGGDAE